LLGEQETARKLLENVETGTNSHGCVFITGALRVFSSHGHEYDAFKVRIVYPPEFPERGRVPSVYLESHRHWRKEEDTHIEDDWRLCLGVPGESEIDFSKPNSFELLIQCVGDFLFKEYLYQKELANSFLTRKRPMWPGPARSHGIDGIREVIQEWGKWGRNEWCPCGSGKKFKRCCLLKMQAS
jgi:hypothetical protein